MSSQGRDISELLSHGNRNLDAQLFAQIMTMFNRRTTPQTKDEAVPRHVLFADLIDLHDITKVLSGTSDIIQVEDCLGFGVSGYRKLVPSVVAAYDLVHDNSNATGITFPFHGITEGDSGPVATIGRKFAGCGLYDGSSYIKINDDAQLKPTDALTIAGWFYLIKTSGTQHIIKMQENDTPYNLRITGTDVLRGRIRTDNAGGTAYNVDIATGNWTDNQWNHVVITWSGTPDNRLRIYLNKVKQGSDVVTAGALQYSGSDGLAIGAGPAVGGNKVTNGTGMSWLSILNFEADQAWIDDHFVGILDTDGNKEITTIPFIDDLKAMSDAFSGMFQG